MQERGEGTTTTDAPAERVRTVDETGAALPVATFSDEDLRPPAELPSQRWRRRGRRVLAPLFASLAAVAGGLAVLASQPRYDFVGLFSLLVVPVIFGGLMGLWPDSKTPGRTAAYSSALALLCLAPFAGEGMICVMFLMPPVALVSAFSAVASSVLWQGRLRRLDERARKMVGVVLLFVLPGVAAFAALRLDEEIFFKPARAAQLQESVTSTVVLPFARAHVWESLRELNVQMAPPPLLSWATLLPQPVALRGQGAALGAEREVVFHNGVVVATVTALVPLERYDIDLHIKDAGREFFDHWIDARTSRFTLEDAPGGGTRLVHTTWYRPKLFPRAVFAPLERSFGGHIQQTLVDTYARAVLAPAAPPQVALQGSP